MIRSHQYPTGCDSESLLWFSPSTTGVRTRPYGCEDVHPFEGPNTDTKCALYPSETEFAVRGSWTGYGWKGFLDLCEERISTCSTYRLEVPGVQRLITLDTFVKQDMVRCRVYPANPVPGVEML